MAKIEDISDEKLENRMSWIVLSKKYEEAGWFLIVISAILSIYEFATIAEPNLGKLGMLFLGGAFLLANAHDASIVGEYLKRKGIAIDSLDDLWESSRSSRNVKLLFGMLLGVGVVSWLYLKLGWWQ